MKTTSKWIALAALMVGTAGTQAALVNRGGGMVYDTTLNITWLADWNHAKSSGFDADGLLDWQTANDWANGLAHGGYTDWRLTKVAQPDTSCSAIADLYGNMYYGGFGCIGSEMGHLFYVDLGGTADEWLAGQTGQTQQQRDNLAMFSGSIPFASYASGTEWVGDSNFIWAFGTEGSQGVVSKSSPFYALAVRDGDVAAEVPEPHSLALALAALGLAGLARRRLG